MLTVWNLSELILVSIAIAGVLVSAKRFLGRDIHGFSLIKQEKLQLSVNSTENLMLSLSQVEAGQRQLISNFSHELRTPLTLVYGYMQSIHRRSENLTDLQKHALEIAIFEMRQTIYLLQESLDLARLDQDSICFLPSSVPLNSLISEVIAASQSVKEREILVEGEELNISVLADVGRLKQVLARLIDNAIRYSDTVITVRLEKLDDYVAISICDRGCGIPIQDQPHIFSPFYRVDRSRPRSFTGGAGLGLAIAKVLVEGMEGTISVHSRLDEGSIFKVMLKQSI